MRVVWASWSWAAITIQKQTSFEYTALYSGLGEVSQVWNRNTMQKADRPPRVKPSKDSIFCWLFKSRISFSQPPRTVVDSPPLSSRHCLTPFNTASVNDWQLREWPLRCVCLDTSPACIYTEEKFTNNLERVHIFFLIVGSFTIIKVLFIRF